MSSKPVAVALCAFLLAAPQAQAQSMASMDVNRDGVLTYKEAKRRFPELSEVIFLKADRNGDGVVDAKELPSLQAIYRQVYVAR